MATTTVGPEVQESVENTVAARFITPGYRWGFAVVVSLFFLWALANNLNDILVRQFQKALGLNRAEAGFIQFVFYIGYFVVAMPAGLLMRRFGYKAGILVGLMLYATGALLFYPASFMLSYGVFLFALFVIASGAACLETAANPYITAFGEPSRAAQRLNLAQAFNGLGGFIAPIMGGLLVFSGAEPSRADLARMSPAALGAYRAGEAGAVRMPYLILAGAALLVVSAVALTRLPPAWRTAGAGLKAQFAGLARSRSLRAAVVAQVAYEAAQVGVWSFFIDFTKEVAPQISERHAAFLLSASLILFMLGRFSGAALMTRVRPVLLLGVYAAINVALCAIAITAPGWIALVALTLTSFFMSIMFPTIFALGIRDLGAATPLGASCIVMAVVGAAISPPLMGGVAVLTGSLRSAMLLPVICFGVVVLYAWLTARQALAEPDNNAPLLRTTP